MTKNDYYYAFFLLGAFFLATTASAPQIEAQVPRTISSFSKEGGKTPEVAIMGYVASIVTCMECGEEEPCPSCSGDYFILADSLDKNKSQANQILVWFDPSVGLREGVSYKMKLRHLNTNSGVSSTGLKYSAEAKLISVMGLE